MKKPLRHSPFIMMKKLSRRYFRHKIDWRRLVFLGATLTISVIVFLMLVHSHQLNKQYFPPPEIVSSIQALNSTSQSIEFPREARLQQVHDSLPATFSSPNEYNRTVQSVLVESERAEPHQRKNSSSGRKEDKKFADATMIITPSPPHGFIPSRLQRYKRFMPPNEALVYAKKEIEHAPTVMEDPDLYIPLFRNISVFKRSYELMETILKVYIYSDGARPIFHKPHLKGIYASEGWFMKQMEGNQQFVTKDPEKAHLFYLPYSARQMELALYVPGSHNLKPLSIFLRDYVNKIASKYPFWNRTHGSDHFLVACHDWGPYTVTKHEELTRNTIKALCNADLSERIFIAGRDVSLPETTIRAPRRPLRHVGGNKVSLRPILAFFAGSMHGRVRPTLLKYWGNEQDEDMKIYKRLPQRVSKRMTYIQHMKSSKYCLCPMGYEVNSPRIVEAIYYECVPVIIADNFVLPFSEVLDWSAFSVVVAEKDIPRLKEILLSIPMKKYLSMQINVKMVQKHFLWNPKPMRYDLFHMILHSIWFSRLNQIQFPQL
ncbi:putative glycosyltransferase [Senna tora]|uniref:Putative glycosyltransferase n=1 Tax=Senna tora TaxID=362788 RepID=A0A834SUE4_9FABA|nr:putative glycosyltransferase [Senna tora]